MKRKKILCFFGTRPEAIKMAPVVQAIANAKGLRVQVALSAQHRGMLDQVMNLFGIRASIDLNLMKAGQSLTDITTRVVSQFEPALKALKPDMVLVHGDTTTTLGGALAAYYQKIPVGHVEAGLRTFDKYQPFPEEMNRRLSDALSTLYFAPTPASALNIKKENLDPSHLYVTGNTVIDALLEIAHRKIAIRDPRVRAWVSAIKKKKERLVLLTAHRRENFGRPFEEAFRALRALALSYPNVHWIYPVHPNPNVVGPVKKILRGLDNFHLTSPLSYSDVVGVMKEAIFVVTDSGGLQEEAPSLGKPVLVLRDVTERPEAVAAGTVALVGCDPKKITRAVSRLLTEPVFYKKMATAVNPYGDGRAASRIAEAVRFYFGLAKHRPVDFKASSK